MVIASKPICESAGAWALGITPWDPVFPPAGQGDLQLWPSFPRQSRVAGGPWCRDLVSVTRSDAVNVFRSSSGNQGADADQATEHSLCAGDSPGSQREVGQAPCSGGRNRCVTSLTPGQPAVVETVFFPLNSQKRGRGHSGTEAQAVPPGRRRQTSS